MSVPQQDRTAAFCCMRGSRKIYYCPLSMQSLRGLAWKMKRKIWRQMGQLQVNMRAQPSGQLLHIALLSKIVSLEARRI